MRGIVKRFRPYRRMKSRFVYLMEAMLILLSTSCINVPQDGGLKESPAFTTDQLDPQSIQVLSWNIKKGQENGWKNAFAGCLNRDLDLILIQEACLDEELEESMAQGNLGWNFATSFISNLLVGCNGSGATGVMNASRTRPLNAKFCRTQHREFYLTPKVSLLSEYELSGTDQTLLVLNVHALNFQWRTDYFESQLQELEKLMAAHQGPIILAGDFNTWRDRRMDLLRIMTGRLGLTEVKFKEDHRTKVFGNCLDHMFYRGLTVKQAQSIPEPAKNPSSDHNRLIVEFGLEV